MSRAGRVCISPIAAPALGDVRALQPGDIIFIREGAQQRADWARYLDAISAAVASGADVRWLRDG